MMPSTWSPPSSLRLRRLRRAEYDQLIALGAFEGEKVELIRGALVEMSPTKPPHSAVIEKLVSQFYASLGARATIRSQSPYVAADESEPEPDVALVAKAKYDHAHPTSAYLVIEVADSSLRFDREIKAPLYAESHVAEYWIVSIERRQVEVYRDPAFGRWNTMFTVDETGTVSPVALADVLIPVADILPEP